VPDKRSNYSIRNLVVDIRPNIISLTHSTIAMAQESERETVGTTSIVYEQLDSPATPRRDSNALEATGLSRIRRQYSRASLSHHATSVTLSQRSTPLSGWAKVKYAVSKFWKNQISVIVDHNACRDHLGMY
jgi:hypothetical protein